MRRELFAEKLVKRPELIRVRLVGDLSGSMDQEKRHVLKQTFVLLMSSLREFNTYLNLTRQQTKSKLEVDTEAWVFGSDTQRIKELRGRGSARLANERATSMQILDKLDYDLGWTYDEKPLEAIEKTLTQPDRHAIQKQKTLEIIFEITDGGSSAPKKTRSVVDRLTGLGVVVRAFQIGQVDQSERQVFDEVWNQDRAAGLGEHVGSDVGRLLPAVTSALNRYLRGVRL